MGVAAALIGGGITVATTATSIGMSEAAKNKASKAAKDAQFADAQARLRERNEEENNLMLGTAASMIDPARAGGNPAAQPPDPKIPR